MSSLTLIKDSHYPIGIILLNDKGGGIFKNVAYC